VLIINSNYLQSKTNEQFETSLSTSKSLQSGDNQRSTTSKVSTSKLSDAVAEVRPSSSAASTLPNVRLVEDIAGGYRQVVVRITVK
jgi:hypothetical protein